MGNFRRSGCRFRYSSRLFDCGTLRSFEEIDQRDTFSGKFRCSQNCDPFLLGFQIGAVCTKPANGNSIEKGLSDGVFSQVTIELARGRDASLVDGGLGSGNRLDSH